MTGPDRIFTSACGKALVTEHPRWAGDIEYIRRDTAILAALPEVQALIRQAVEAQQQRLTAWCDARQADVMGCLELMAQEEATAIGWIDNFRAAIRKRGDAALCECGHYAASPLDGDCANCGSPVNRNQTK